MNNYRFISAQPCKVKSCYRTLFPEKLKTRKKPVKFQAKLYIFSVFSFVSIEGHARLQWIVYKPLNAQMIQAKPYAFWSGKMT